MWGWCAWARVGFVIRPSETSSIVWVQMPRSNSDCALECRRSWERQLSAPKDSNWDWLKTWRRTMDLGASWSAGMCPINGKPCCRSCMRSRSCHPICFKHHSNNPKLGPSGLAAAKTWRAWGSEPSSKVWDRTWSNWDWASISAIFFLLTWDTPDGPNKATWEAHVCKRPGQEGGAVRDAKAAKAAETCWSWDLPRAKIDDEVGMETPKMGSWMELGPSPSKNEELVSSEHSSSVVSSALSFGLPTRTLEAGRPPPPMKEESKMLRYHP